MFWVLFKVHRVYGVYRSCYKVYTVYRMFWVCAGCLGSPHISTSNPPAQAETQEATSASPAKGRCRVFFLFCGLIGLLLYSNSPSRGPSEALLVILIGCNWDNNSRRCCPNFGSRKLQPILHGDGCILVNRQAAHMEPPSDLVRRMPEFLTQSTLG